MTERPTEDPELREELLRVVRGSPQPGVGAAALAEQLGAHVDEVHALVNRLEREGVLRREGDRLVAVQPAPPDRS